MDIPTHHQPIEVYSRNKQYQPSHCENKEGCCRRNDRCSSSSVNQDSPVRLHEKCYDIIQPTTTDPLVKWSRNNIAMTMEYFEPISATSTPKGYSSQTDYSYAYYEPGAAMRHSIPKTQTTAGPHGTSARSSPKSIRSLLSKPDSDKTKPNNRHTYTTRYGTQENIYEDVSSMGTRSDLEASSQSLNGQGCSKIEFQDILHNHYRVLEQLNLSVEELLLSTTTTTKTKANMLSPRKILKRSTKPRTKVSNSEMVNSKIVFPSSVNEMLIGEDSGFSGSSSGASYIGGLRNYKTALTRPHRCPTETNTFYDVSNPNRFQFRDATNVEIRKDHRTKSLQVVDKFRGDKSSGSMKGLKFPFWNKR